jgi:phenylalanyl-tRNA synthetase alpha chain
MNERISELRSAGEAAIADAPGTSELEEVRVRFLGRKAELPNLLRGVAQLPADQRGQVGRAANEARRALEQAIEQRRAELEAAELDARLAADVVDVTLPGSPAQPVGRLHLLTQTRRELEDIFVGLGFRVVEGPEVETVAYNFDGLNHDETHPARLWSDTFYVDDDIVLRTHTSPMQARIMEQTEPPVRVVVPGRVYRYESQDASHEWMFHQLEGLAVDHNITMADLKGTLAEMARQLFGPERRIRFRCDFFPFVEPGVDFAVDCSICGGAGCRVCKGSGWLEMGGAGLVHPNVLRAVGYDPDIYSGFAFGLGIERLTMMRSGVDDVRAFAGNDLRFLRQFARAA